MTFGMKTSQTYKPAQDDLLLPQNHLNILFGLYLWLFHTKEG